MALPAHFSQNIQDVRAVYHKLDGQIEKFQSSSGLRCANGCGRCCDNPNVTATVLEVLPLAFELWQKQQAGSVMDKIDSAPAPEICVFYAPDPKIPGNGRCTVYEWRPLLCRLFGYSAKTDKYGRPVLVTCPTMKNLCSQEFQDVSKRLQEKDLPAVMMLEYAMQVFNIDPHLGKEQWPINEAVKKALEKIALVFLK